MRTRSHSALSIVATGVVVLSTLAALGCSSSSGGTAGSGSPTPAAGEALTGHVWKATEIAGTATLAGQKATEVTAVFDGSRLSGSGGVNRYTAVAERPLPVC